MDAFGRFGFTTLAQCLSLAKHHDLGLAKNRRVACVHTGTIYESCQQQPHAILSQMLPMLL